MLSKYEKKGQANLVDILILGLFISLVFVLGLFQGDERLSSQILREESAYSQSMLDAAFNYRNNTYGGFSNPSNLSLGDAIASYLCHEGPIPRSSLEASLGFILNRTVKPGYDYIFYADINETRTIWTWNRQADVCVKYIPLSKFDLELPCNLIDTKYTQPILGIWPDWKELPPGSEC